MRDAFDLDPSVVHLNHGSFGAVPRPVAEAQRRVRDRAEANPMRFHRVDAPGLREQARQVAADFLGLRADDVAMVRNVTQATATILASLAHRGRLGPGDVVVVTDQSYESVRWSVARWCERTGATEQEVVIPPTAEEDAVVAAYEAALAEIRAGGRRARLVVVDHVCSPTGAVLPVSRVCAAARGAGALSFVDAAHVPGQLAARPAETGADFWSGTWHKWGFAPRGTTALWVAEAERETIEPLTTSRNHDRPYPWPFDVHGTDDYTGWFCLADAVEFWRAAGALEIGERGRRLLDDGAARVAGVLPESDVPVPAHQAPCLRLVPLPPDAAASPAAASRLYERLSARGVETQVVASGSGGFLRLSGAVYNEAADYERLAEELPGVLRARPGHR